MSDNFEYLGYGSYYLVRTQAGFKQALKDWDGDSNLDCETFPTVYPAVIQFSYVYSGYMSTHSHIWTVSEWRTFVSKVENIISTSDLDHLNKLNSTNN